MSTLRRTRFGSLRIVTCLWLVGIVLAGITSSHAQTPTPSNLTLWHPYTGAQEAELIAWVEAYNATDPLIPVQAVGQTDSGRLYDQVIANLLADDPTLLPHMVIGPPAHAAMFALSGRVVDLRDYAPDAVAVYQQLGQSPFNQAHYGWVIDVYEYVMVVNETALAELNQPVPTTVTAWRELTCDFRQAGGWSAGKFGAVWGAELPLEGDFVWAWLAAQGYSIFAFDTRQYTLAGVAEQASLAQLADVENIACASIVTDSALSLDNFASGRALFYFVPSNQLGAVTEAIDGHFVEPFAWSAYPLPSDSARPLPYLQGTVISILNQSPTENEAAWAFITWLDSQIALSPPTRPVQYAPMWAGGEIGQLETGFMWRRILQANIPPAEVLPQLELTLNDTVQAFYPRD